MTPGGSTHSDMELEVQRTWRAKRDGHAGVHVARTDALIARVDHRTDRSMVLYELLPGAQVVDKFIEVDLGG